MSFKQAPFRHLNVKERWPFLDSLHAKTNSFCFICPTSYSTPLKLNVKNKCCWPQNASNSPFAPICVSFIVELKRWNREGKPCYLAQKCDRHLQAIDSFPSDRCIHSSDIKHCNYGLKMSNSRDKGHNSFLSQIKMAAVDDGVCGLELVRLCCRKICLRRKTIHIQIFYVVVCRCVFIFFVLP